MTVYKRDRLSTYRDLTTAYLGNWTRAGWELQSVLPFPYGGGNGEYLLLVIWRKNADSPPDLPGYDSRPDLQLVTAEDSNPAAIRLPDPQIPRGYLLCGDFELEATCANTAAIPA